MNIKFSGKNSTIGRDKSSEKIESFLSDEKMFDFDGIYDSENDGIWAVNREEENRRDGKKQ